MSTHTTPLKESFMHIRAHRAGEKRGGLTGGGQGGVFSSPPMSIGQDPTKYQWPGPRVESTTGVLT